MRKAVIGVGNEFMGDDGIGPLIISRLGEIDGFPTDVDLIDEGSGGMRIIHDMEGYDKVLIIDAADFGGAPGEFRIFNPEDIDTVKKISGRSLHEMDLIKTIELARMMGRAPSEIMIMAIQPERVEMSQKISGPILERIDDLLDEIHSFFI
ncbi:MAG: hydrogenase maturation protease [Thermoplasmatota archaeon]